LLLRTESVVCFKELLLKTEEIQTKAPKPPPPKKKFSWVFYLQERFLYSKTSRLGKGGGDTQPLILWVPVVFPRGRATGD
jgi:hypothetical protein